jgi:hypothetical protein
MSTATQDKKIAREIRVDRIGFANELVKQFADGLKDDVKARMKSEELDVVEGDFFEGKYVQGTVGTVDPVRVFKLIKSGRLKESEFLQCIRVERGKLEEFLSGRDIDALSSFAPSTPQLRVSRKKGVEVKLVDALRGLNQAIGDG